MFLTLRMLLNDVMNLNISMNKKMKNPLLIIWLCLYIVFNALCSFFSCRYRMHCWCCSYHVVAVSCWQRRNAKHLVSPTYCVAYVVGIDVENIPHVSHVCAVNVVGIKKMMMLFLSIILSSIMSVISFNRC